MKIRALLKGCTVSVITIIVCDLAGYAFTPKQGLPALPLYKTTSAERSLFLKQAIRDYPRGYHQPDSQMGFDIAPNRPPTDFAMSGQTFSIFSNELGCMDRHALKEIQGTPCYEFITGDSFTWGYGQYESKYATVYEALTGRLVVKGGMTHTGQSHQFDKFQRVVKAIGHYPKRVIIGYCENDVVNDFAYPHTTVIEGFQVDTVQVDSRYRLVKRDMEMVRQTIESSIDNNVLASKDHFAQWPKRYSLCLNLLDSGYRALRSALIPTAALGPSVNTSIKAGSSLYPLYKLCEKVRFDRSYLTLPITEPNRRAISRWARDAHEHSYQLLFVLIPLKEGYKQVPSYDGLKAFLQAQEVPYLDLAEVFRETGKPADFFYWQQDGHWNNEGNEFVGAYLARTLDGPAD